MSRDVEIVSDARTGKHRVAPHLSLAWRLPKLPPDETDCRPTFRLMVASGDDDAFFIRGRARILLKNSLETDFILDTGCQRTLVSPDVAKRLQLKRTGKTTIEFADARSQSGYNSFISVLVHSNWWKIPCDFPDESLIHPRMKNYLGMEGFLGSHFFCVGRNELFLFRYPEEASDR